MRRFSQLTITTAFCLLAANVFAHGATDKIKGTYTRASCDDSQCGEVLGFEAHRLLFAREAKGRRPQRGFMFSWTDTGVWFALDFSDTYNTCVNVYDDGRARIGGVIRYGNGPQVGRAFGFYLEDNGKPGYFSDKGATWRFTTKYNSEDARQYLKYWCKTGELLNDYRLDGFVVWPSIVIDGDLVIRNSPKDGD